LFHKNKKARVPFLNSVTAPNVDSAYRDLLFGEIPRTATDYRRAIMLAVMIGREIEAGFPSSSEKAAKYRDPDAKNQAALDFANALYEANREEFSTPSATSRSRA
jgi:hypothetical protein